VAKDEEAYPLLWLDGVELDGKDTSDAYFHVVCLGQVKGIDREAGLVEAMKAAREEGALLIAAHPHWCGISMGDCLRWSFDGVEIYNHICHWLNGKSNGLVYWDVALQQNPNTLALAVDDAHLKSEHPGWNGGWIVVNAEECSQQSIMAAIGRGNFYASCGPQFKSIVLDGDEVVLTTSPVRFIRLVGPSFRGKRAGTFDGSLVSDARFSIPDDWRYAYLEIEDEGGRRAWTNNLFIDEDSSNRETVGA
jgi:hypothetical protein